MALALMLGVTSSRGSCRPGRLQWFLMRLSGPGRQPAKTIFISCVSREFGQFRLRLANQLGGLRGEPFHTLVQEDFPQGGFSLLEWLDDTIAKSDVVVHLLGSSAGALVPQEEVDRLERRWGAGAAGAAGPRSYTQWEYWIARRHGKAILVYVYAGPSVDLRSEPESLMALQRAHVGSLEPAEHWKRVASAHEFVREVHHDLGLKSDFKPNTLPYRSLGPCSRVDPRISNAWIPPLVR